MAQKATLTALWGGFSLLVASCVAQVTPRVTLEDPRGDDYGPGSFRYPLDRIHSPGAYDLTRVSFGVDRDEVVLVVEIRGSFLVAEGADAARYNALSGAPPSVRPTEETAGGLALQNIEIYIDLDGDPTTGEHRALPGRGVIIASGWERAIWLCPRPLRARTELARRDPEMARNVLIPTALSARGRTLEARFPVSELGKEPSPAWGYTVLVTGAISENTFGNKDLPLFVRPVRMAPDAESFGGGAVGAPPIIDLWVPEGAKPSQEELLSSASPTIPGRSGDGALVRAAPPEAPPRKTPLASATPAPTSNVSPLPESQAPKSALAESQPTSLEAGDMLLAKVIERREDIVTLKIPAGLSPGRIGELSGNPDILVILTEVFGEIGIARVLRSEQREAIVPGAEVLFQRKTP